MRARLTPGASNTCSARLLASVAMTSPNTPATRVERRRHGGRRRQRGRLGRRRMSEGAEPRTTERVDAIVLADADRAVGDAQRRDAERRDSAHMPRAVALRQLGNDLGRVADQLLLLWRASSRRPAARPAASGERSVHPWQGLGFDSIRLQDRRDRQRCQRGHDEVARSSPGHARSRLRRGRWA